MKNSNVAHLVLGLLGSTGAGDFDTTLDKQVVINFTLDNQPYTLTLTREGTTTAVLLDRLREILGDTDWEATSLVAHEPFSADDVMERFLNLIYRQNARIEQSPETADTPAMTTIYPPKGPAWVVGFADPDHPATSEEPYVDQTSPYTHAAQMAISQLHAPVTLVISRPLLTQ